MEYRTQLDIAKEEAGELKAAIFLRHTNHIEAHRHLFIKNRYMEGKVKERSTLKAITQVEG